MNLPEISCNEETAVDIVIGVVNKAHFKMGNRQNLFQLANSMNIFGQAKINCNSLKPPLGHTSEDLIVEAIERVWRLTDTFMYVLEYKGTSQDESAQFYYHEAVFSQPTAAYPIPQATVSVFFRVDDMHIDPSDQKRAPMMWFRIEGHHAEHDVRYIKLTVDWLLAVLKMKIKFFRRVEELNMF